MSLFTGTSPSDAAPPTPATGPPPVSTHLPSPTLADAELVGRIRDLFQRARNERQPVFNQWAKNRRIFSNRTWATNRESWMPAPEVPEIRPIVATCVSWVTDQRPALELIPAAPPFSPYAAFFEKLAQDMKTAINAAWVTHQWEAEISKCVWDAYQFSIGFLKVVWDNSLVHGQGDVSLRRIDPAKIYCDPQATSDHDMNYILEVGTISLQELDRRFPGAAEKFEVQGYLENVDELPRTTGYTSSNLPRANPGAISPATSARYGLPGQSRDHVAQNDEGVTLIEAWLREHTIYESDGVTKLYECWRVVCIAGPYVLMNERAIDIMPFERHPFVAYRPEDLGEFYGQSMVELLAPLQVCINRILASLQNNIDLTGNPVLVEDSRAGTQRTQWPHRPGGRMTKAPNSQVSFMDPPQMQPMMPDLVKFYITEMEKISGLDAISRGQVPGGRVAADVLDNMQEAGFVRIRMALRNLEYTLRTVGQLAAAFVAEFYTDARLISLVGPDGEKSTLALNARHFYIPTDNDTEEDALPLRFQVLIHAGSMLPTSRSARVGEADQLFIMGAIDRSAVLEAHSWPNRHNIEERMADMDAKGITQAPTRRAATGRVT